MKRIVSGIMLTLFLLISMLTLAFNIQPIKASGTIYIRADGSIDPPTAPIATVDNVTYTFTDNINDSIVIERDNIVVDGAGYIVEGTGSGGGITLLGRTNITIKNTIIKSFTHGIVLIFSNNTIISGNNIANNFCGITLGCSSNNRVSGNNITANHWYGIHLSTSSNYNSIAGNNITANNGYGIWLDSSSNNSIAGNNITANNTCGIRLIYSSDNKFYHNNFVNNTQQVYIDTPGYANVWDDDYPSGGNYWSDYTGVDLYHGPYQNKTESDGIGDTPYVIDTSNQDNYPLMEPWSPSDIAATDITTYTKIGFIIIQRNIFPPPPISYRIYVNVTVQNQGNKIEAFNITVYANESFVDNRTNVFLFSGNSTTLNFEWNTTGFDKGNYTIWAYVSPISGEADVTDNKVTDGWIIITILGDINGDFKVDIKDLVLVIKHYASYPAHPMWNSNADVNSDGKVDIKDLVLVIKHFGEHDP